MEKKAWVISVDMGYGHQRAAYPLKDIAYERIRIEREAWLEIHKEKEAASAVIGELRVTLELMRKKLTFLMVCFCALAALVVVRFLLGSRK